MSIREDERDTARQQLMDRRIKDDNFFIAALFYAVPASMDIVEHRRKWREIERNVIAQCAAVWPFHSSSMAFVYQVRVTNLDEIWIDASGVSTVQSVIENPRYIIPMYDPEDQGCLTIEFW